MRPITFNLAAVLVCLGRGILLGADAPPSGEAVPASGAAFRAQLQSLSADGMATWKPERGEIRKLPLADLCWWGSFAEPPAQSQIVLVDGSLIVAEVVSLDKQQLTIDWSVAGEVKLPLEWVGGILIAPPVDQQEADRLRFQFLSNELRKPQTKASATGQPDNSEARSDTDRLILFNGDELSGEIVAMSDSAVKIRTTAGETSIAKEKIAAIALDPSLAAKPDAKQPRVWVGFKDGSRLVASALTVDAGQAKLTTVALPRVTVPAAKVIAIQPLDGRAIYLSDLKPAGYQHIPFLDLKWPYRNDRNVLGSQLRAGGRLYLKGLGMHSAARLTYELDKPYRALAAEVAIDDQTTGRGSALFRVYTDDGSGKWQLKYESPIVRGGAAAVPLSVDLTGAKRLSLLVDFADHGDEQAHADWLNARLLP
jgi:NPCBM/NEW2 domain